MEKNNQLVHLLVLFFIGVLCSACEKTPSWADEMNQCLGEEDISQIITSLKRFEQVLMEKEKGADLYEKYQNYLTKISISAKAKGYYHELLIKESTKKMLYSDFYSNMWQKSEEWVLNDGKGTGVYLINGYADIPQCLAEKSNSIWLKNKIESLKQSGYPIPSKLANDMLKSFSRQDFENQQLRAFIALSLCYTQSIAYYDKEER